MFTWYNRRQIAGTPIFNNYFFLSFLFISLVAVMTEQTVHSLLVQYRALDAHLERIKEQLKEEQQLQAALLQEQNSQSDPAWVELVLKRELGLVSEKETKIIFY